MSIRPTNQRCWAHWYQPLTASYRRYLHVNIPASDSSTGSQKVFLNESHKANQWVLNQSNSTLCGSMASISAGDILAASNSFLATSDVLPFISASVWARKLASRIYIGRINLNSKILSETGFFFYCNTNHFAKSLTLSLFIRPLCSRSMFIKQPDLIKINIFSNLPIYPNIYISFKRKGRKSIITFDDIFCNLSTRGGNPDLPHGGDPPGWGSGFPRGLESHMVPVAFLSYRKIELLSNQLHLTLSECLNVWFQSRNGCY